MWLGVVWWHVLFWYNQCRMRIRAVCGDGRLLYAVSSGETRVGGGVKNGSLDPQR